MDSNIDRDLLVRLYKTAKHGYEQIDIAAQLMLTDVDTIIHILQEEGVFNPADLKKFRKCKKCGRYVSCRIRNGLCDRCIPPRKLCDRK